MLLISSVLHQALLCDRTEPAQDPKDRGSLRFRNPRQSPRSQVVEEL